MASHHEIASRYWGSLIQHDKKPSPLLEELLLGIASYIKKHVAPWDVNCLTPPKLATFYRLVGGNYDTLFLAKPNSSLSFIYQSLGCFHTLQPEKDAYAPPAVPALTALGFVKWQTVQLLLDPQEHVPFLQEAVKRFDLINAQDGEPFPSRLPRETLPLYPDRPMREWYDTVLEKLMLDSQGLGDRTDHPPRPPMTIALSDIGTDDSRPTSRDSHSIDSLSIVDAASYFQEPRRYDYATNPPPPIINIHPPPRVTSAPVYHDPWSQLRRQNSLPQSYAEYCNPAHRSAPQHHHKHATTAKRPHGHTRSPSTVSTGSYSSDSSSVSTSSASQSPVQHYAHVSNPPLADRFKRSSAGMSLYRTNSQPNVPSQLQNTGRAPQMVPNPQGRNVRFQDPPPKSAWTPPRQPIRGWDPRAAPNGAHRGYDPGLSRARSVGSRPVSAGYGQRRQADPGFGKHTNGKGWR